MELYVDIEKAGKAHLPDGSERFAYNVDNERGVIYIPVNRLKQVYQTDSALNPKKVKGNMQKMKEGTPLKPVEVGYNYDVHDGHHRWEAAKQLGHTHVPVKVVGTDADKVREAKTEYRKVWKSGDLSLVLDLNKAMHMLNRGKLIKRQVIVKRTDGRTYTRMQWVDPSDANPGIVHGANENQMDSTYAHHTEGLRDMEKRLSNRFPVVHPEVGHLKNTGKIDRNLVEHAKQSYHAGEKLAPVKVNHKGEVVEGHHLVEMAKQLGLSHVPAVVMGNPVEKKRLEESLKEQTMVHDNDTGQTLTAFQANPSNRVNVTSEYAGSIKEFENHISKFYTKGHLMTEARRQGIQWNETTKSGGKLDEASPIMWMRAYTAICEHLRSGKVFEVQHVDKDVDRRMQEDGKDEIHKFLLLLVQKHDGKQNLMEWVDNHDIKWRHNSDPNINWMHCATAIKKRLAQGHMVDGLRIRRKGLMEESNLMVTKQHKEMVNALGRQHGKNTVMSRATELGIKWDTVDKKGNKYPDNINWMHASEAIQHYIARGNTFTMSDEDDGKNGMTATVGDYGDNVKLNKYQALAVDLGKRNSQNFEPKVKEWGIHAIKTDNPHLSDGEAAMRYDRFVSNARQSKVMYHFDPFEMVDQNTSRLEQMISDGTIRNQYQSNDFGNSWREAREVEDRELFGIDYDDASDADRPVIGVVDLLNNGLSSNHGGSVALVFKDAVKKRGTGLYTDSAELYEANGKYTRSLEDPHQMIADRWMTRWNKAKNIDKIRQRAMDAVISGDTDPDMGYFEAHIHGGIDFNRDIDHVLLPQEWKSSRDFEEHREMMKMFGEMHNIPIKYEGDAE